MSATKLRSTHYYSPLRVEADQKEVIIAQLKEEIFILKKNEEEYYVLEDQYRKLDHRYRLLCEQKIRSDTNFAQRHQVALKSTNSLKNQLENLRTVLRERTLQLDDFQTDASTLKTQIDQRLIEVDKLQNQLRSLASDAAELQCEKQRLQANAAQVRADNHRHFENIRKFQIENDRCVRQAQDTDKYSDKLRVEQKILKQKIINFENENNSLDDQINRIMDDLAAIDRGIGDLQTQIKHLQANIAEAGALCDKYKSDAIHLQKSTQSEVMRNNENSKLLNQAENTLKVRINQVDTGRKEIAALNQQNNNVDQANNRLEDDFQFCRRHLQNLALLNSDLVMNLEKYSEEDEVVRNLIDRKKRVAYSRAKVEDCNSMLQRTSIRESPSKIYY